MLMDMFYDCVERPQKKQRQHFHSFMLDVHNRIHEWKKVNRFGKALFSPSSRIRPHRSGRRDVRYGAQGGSEFSDFQCGTEELILRSDTCGCGTNLREEYRNLFGRVPSEFNQELVFS